MASTTAATMVKAAVVAVLLMQCCDVILVARPLLHVALPSAKSTQQRSKTLGNCFAECNTRHTTHGINSVGKQ